MFRRHAYGPRIVDVIRAASDVFNVPSRDITGPSRRRLHVLPRHVAMCVARDITRSSYPVIAARFDGRDHTTVLWADRKIRRLRADDPDVRAMTDAVARRAHERAQDYWAGVGQ